ncbi:MAG: hypothetical protein C0417_08565 [Chlorobiaceae bacterium]|nr:hypothetical protein [Chlorobiaceae bacterium]
MKYFIILFLIVLFYKPLNGQDKSKELSYQKSFMEYEDTKKDKASALIWLSIIPGGGMWYAETNGLFFLGSEIVLASLYIGTKENFWLAGLTAMKLYEVYYTFSVVDDYNQNLLKELKMDLSYNNQRGIVYSLSFNF